MAHGHPRAGEQKRGGVRGDRWRTNADIGMGHGRQGLVADLKGGGAIAKLAGLPQGQVVVDR